MTTPMRDEIEDALRREDRREVQRVMRRAIEANNRRQLAAVEGIIARAREDGRL